MTIKQLEQFIAINQYKSINQAAEKLFISQPNLSYSLRALEKEIGFPLFNRTPHGMELTSNGKIVLADTYTILSLVSSWNALEQSSKKQKIIFEGAGVVADFLIPKIISSCCDKLPHLLFEAQENTVAQLIEQPPAQTGTSLIMLDFLSDDKLLSALSKARTNGWSYKIIKKGHGTVLMNVNTPLAHQNHLSVHDFSSYFIAKDQYLVTNSAYNSAADFFQYFDKEKMLITSSRASTFRLIALSENIISLGSFLADYSSEYIANGSIVCRSVDDFPMASSLVAFYHSTHNAQNIEAILQITEQVVFQTTNKELRTN
jgi:hypothetical protein